MKIGAPSLFGERTAISSQLSADSYQQSAISYQHSAISYQHSAISSQQSAYSNQLKKITIPLKNGIQKKDKIYKVNNGFRRYQFNYCPPY